MAYEKHIDKLQRTFTSIVFKQLNVRKLNKNIQKNTVVIKDEIRMEDYLDKNPDELEDTLLYLYLSPHQQGGGQEE